MGCFILLEEVRAWMDGFSGRQAEVERALRSRITNRCDDEEIEIPFPQRVIHAASTPAGVELPRA